MDYEHASLKEKQKVPRFHESLNGVFSSPHHLDFLLNQRLELRGCERLGDLND